VTRKHFFLPSGIRAGRTEVQLKDLSVPHVSTKIPYSLKEVRRCTLHRVGEIANTKGLRNSALDSKAGDIVGLVQASKDGGAVEVNSVTPSAFMVQD
jgi:hypothetical protein